MLFEVWGFRAGEKVLVDSWVEDTCPACGCVRGVHAMRCAARRYDR
jgi:hypothetical protein